MRRSQKATIIIFILSILLTGFFPPVYAPVSKEGTFKKHCGYRFLLDINYFFQTEVLEQQIATENYIKARDEGYSNKEIAEYLAKDAGYDLKSAVAAGYTYKEIIDHLQPPQTSKSLDLKWQKHGADVQNNLSVNIALLLSHWLGLLIIFSGIFSIITIRQL